MDALALVAGMERDAIRAATLFGAAEALRRRASAAIPPVFQGNYDVGVSVARQQLDDDAFACAWTKGLRMATEEALALAGS